MVQRPVCDSVIQVGCIPNLVFQHPSLMGSPGGLIRRGRGKLFSEPIRAINAGGSGDLRTWASALKKKSPVIYLNHI